MAAQAGERSRTSSSSAVPERSDNLAHLTLDGLRGYRTALTAEENRVSYWRRLVQARLDVLRSGQSADHLGLDRLRNVLSQDAGRGRGALTEAVPFDDAPPLPDLVALWSREVRPNDVAYTDALRRDLAFAELQLSAYRSALHQRLAQATDELIARYRDQPGDALAALPLRRR